MNAPCKDCPDRHQGCHCECEKYKVFRKERDEINSTIQKAKELEYAEHSRYRQAMKIRQKRKKYWY